MFLYFQVYFDLKSGQDGKINCILQALIYFDKLPIDLRTFLHFGYIFNLDFIAFIALQKTYIFEIDC